MDNISDPDVVGPPKSRAGHLKVIRMSKKSLRDSQKFTDEELLTSVPQFKVENRHRRDSTLTTSRKRISAYEFLIRKEEVKLWFSEIFQQPFDDLISKIKDGNYLCQLFNLVYPGSIPKINKPNSPSFLQMENIQFFVQACQKSATVASEIDMFQPIDLFEEKNIPKVIKCLVAFEGLAKKAGFSVVMKKLEKSTFSEAELQEAEKMLQSLEKKDVISKVVLDELNLEAPLPRDDDSASDRSSVSDAMTASNQSLGETIKLEDLIQTNQDTAEIEESPEVSENVSLQNTEPGPSTEELTISETTSTEIDPTENDSDFHSDEQLSVTSENLTDEVSSTADSTDIPITSLELITSPSKRRPYKAAKDDKIDEMLASFLNVDQEVATSPIKRITGGYYMVGSLKVHMKNINDKLVARVGGGWMNIDEFLKKYGREETQPAPVKETTPLTSPATKRSNVIQRTVEKTKTVTVQPPVKMVKTKEVVKTVTKTTTTAPPKTSTTTTTTKSTTVKSPNLTVKSATTVKSPIPVKSPEPKKTVTATKTTTTSATKPAITTTSEKPAVAKVTTTTSATKPATTTAATTSVKPAVTTSATKPATTTTISATKPTTTTAASSLRTSTTTAGKTTTTATSKNPLRTSATKPTATTTTTKASAKTTEDIPKTTLTVAVPVKSSKSEESVMKKPTITITKTTTTTKTSASSVTSPVKSPRSATKTVTVTKTVTKATTGAPAKSNALAAVTSPVKSPRSRVILVKDTKKTTTTTTSTTKPKVTKAITAPEKEEKKETVPEVIKQEEEIVQVENQVEEEDKTTTTTKTKNITISIEEDNKEEEEIIVDEEDVVLQVEDQVEETDNIEDLKVSSDFEIPSDLQISSDLVIPEDQDVSLDNLQDLVSSSDNLDNLNNLQDLVSSENLDNLNNLQDLVSSDNLDNLNNLQDLVSSENLDNLNNLQDLVSSDNLDNLNNLQDLVSSDNLDSLNNLQDLVSSDNLNNLQDLASSDNLNNLQDLSSSNNYLDNLRDLVATSSKTQDISSLQDLVVPSDNNNLSTLKDLVSSDTLRDLDQFQLESQLDVSSLVIPDTLSDAISDLKIDTTSTEFSYPLSHSAPQRPTQTEENFLDLFKKKKPNSLMSLFKEEEEEPESEISANFHPDFSHIPKSTNSLRQVFAIEDTNETGLKRAKKGITMGKKKVYQMEDQHFVLHLDGFTLLGVFDGHVDKMCALDAKEIFPKEFSLEVSKEGKISEDVFKKVFAVVDDKLKKYDTEGCTATVICIFQENSRTYVQCANVGDSEAFMWNNGEFVELTVDHKLTNTKEFQRLKDSGVEVHEGKTRINGLAVSRSLGDHFAKEMNLGLIGEPYVSPKYEIISDAVIVLASDGLWDVVSGKRGIEIALNEGSADKMAKKLMSTALANKKCNDNVTVVTAII